MSNWNVDVKWKNITHDNILCFYMLENPMPLFLWHPYHPHHQSWFCHHIPSEMIGGPGTFILSHHNWPLKLSATHFITSNSRWGFIKPVSPFWSRKHIDMNVFKQSRINLMLRFFTTVCVFYKTFLWTLIPFKKLSSIHRMVLS